MKQKSLAKLKKDLWFVFATWVKKRDNYVCFTCGVKTSGRNSQAGHFIKKSVGGLDLYFNEKNVHCQCSGCNLGLDGNQYEYGIRLGREIVAELYAIKARKKPIWTRADYERKIAIYKEKLSPMKGFDTER